MEHIIKKAEGDKPLVDFNPTSGRLILKGESYPEYPGTFYTPLLDWTEHFLETQPDKIEFVIHLRYFNSSSSKCLIDFLELFEDFAEKGGNVKIVWQYDQGDVDALEAGRDLDEDIDLNFMFEEVPRE